MSQILAWICLALMASTAAYGVHLTAAAMAPTAGAPPQVTPARVTRHVLFVAVDPVTGDRAEADCELPSDRYTSDTFLVDPNDFRAIAQTCNDPLRRE